jgi:hypothetical protein
MAKPKKLAPFHETVREALAEEVTGNICDSEFRQGEVFILLSLIYRTEIPTHALPDVAEACRGAIDSIIQASQSSISHRIFLEQLADTAEEVAEELERRAGSKQGKKEKPQKGSRRKPQLSNPIIPSV